MDITVEHDRFTTEDEAIELARAAGLVPVALDLDASGHDHWHDFDANVYVVDGSVRVTVAETGETCELTAGSVIVGQPRLVHREESDGYRAVVGFGCDPAALTMPIDKAPADLV